MGFLWSRKSLRFFRWFGCSGTWNWIWMKENGFQYLFWICTNADKKRREDMLTFFSLCSRYDCTVWYRLSRQNSWGDRCSCQLCSFDCWNFIPRSRKETSFHFNQRYLCIMCTCSPWDQLEFILVSTPKVSICSSFDSRTEDKQDRNYHDPIAGFYQRLLYWTKVQPYALLLWPAQLVLQFCSSRIQFLNRVLIYQMSRWLEQALSTQSIQIGRKIEKSLAKPLSFWSHWALYQSTRTDLPACEATCRSASWTVSSFEFVLETSAFKKGFCFRNREKALQ